ncbi:MAG: hypothetical protein E7434_04745 [Ruminococcaceae bacterium]|nr:hypothetical protein [Oscillospiraceae bacterium]
MKKRFIIAAIFASALGSALHFLYELLPSIPTALIAPVNESPWEHLKLLYYPTLLAAFFLTRRAKCKTCLWSAFFLVLLLMPIFLLSVYYALVYLGLDSVVVDIGLYFVTMLLGFFLAYRLKDSKRIERIGGYLLMLVILYGAALILFSFAAPDLPLFQAG